MTDESVLHEKEGAGGSFYLCSFSPILGEKCQIIEMAFKKKSLSKTLQVLGMVSIVNGMNAIQLKLAAHLSLLFNY